MNHIEPAAVSAHRRPLTLPPCAPPFLTTAALGADSPWSSPDGALAQTGGQNDDLAQLAQLYWKPIYRIIRYRWSRTADEAQDLTQEFFVDCVIDSALVQAFAPERGSFWSFLRGALDNFMKNTLRDAGRIKRGGRMQAVSLEADARELMWFAPELAPPTPEQTLDLARETQVLRRATERVRQQLEAAGHADHFEAFRRYDLDGESDDLTYEEFARTCGWTVRKLRRVLTSTRAAFRQALTQVVCPTVDGAMGLANAPR